VRFREGGLRYAVTTHRGTESLGCHGFSRRLSVSVCRNLRDSITAHPLWMPNRALERRPAQLQKQSFDENPYGPPSEVQGP